MRDDRTPRGYPLPSTSNSLRDDLPRLRESFGLVDGDMTMVAGRISALEATREKARKEAEEEAFARYMGISDDLTDEAVFFGIEEYLGLS
uniref:Uncharacterized protein n=1 Tax=Candidatus Kentrum sp. LFY TaxID=2126342 RepID=A0A450WGT8_9GAMM|nr:MAG: hypothetical protein BECKLFY1418C_GA0070996_102245 [Candidatus Kentron sp. LFY]